MVILSKFVTLQTSSFPLCDRFTTLKHLVKTQVFQAVANPFSISMLILTLEAKCSGLFGDDALEVGDFFRVHAVIDGKQFFLSAFDGVFGSLFVDLPFAQRHVGEDDGFVLADFCEAGTDRQSDNLAFTQVAELTGL